MTHERHIQFVEDLVELQGQEGKRISGMVLRGLSKMLKVSRGDVRRFLKIVKAAKKVVVKRVAKEVIGSQQKAKKLGKSFGEDIANGDAEE